MEFLGFAARRTAHTAVTLVLLLAFMFVLFRLIPGDPRPCYLAPGSSHSRRSSAFALNGVLTNPYSSN